MRFFSVSFSLDKRAVKNFLDYENAAFLNGMPVVDVSRCGVVPLLELFNIKKTETTSNLSLTLPHLGVAQEWENLTRDFDAISPSVATKTNERSATLRRLEREVWNLFETEIPTNIIDVFKVVPKERFPFLWRVVVRVLTTMPTTVSCEQSFSYFKRTIHTNMGEKTADFSNGKNETIR